MKYLKQNIHNIRTFVDDKIDKIQSKYSKTKPIFKLNDNVFLLSSSARIEPAYITKIENFRSKGAKPGSTIYYWVKVKQTNLSKLDILLIKLNRYFNASKLINYCIPTHGLVAGEDLFTSYDDAYNYLIYTDVKASLEDLSDLEV